MKKIAKKEKAFDFTFSLGLSLFKRKALSAYVGGRYVFIYRLAVFLTFCSVDAAVGNGFSRTCFYHFLGA